MIDDKRLTLIADGLRELSKRQTTVEDYQFCLDCADLLQGYPIKENPELTERYRKLWENE